MIHFHGTIEEAKKHFHPSELHRVVCKWQTDKERRKYFFRLILRGIFVTLGAFIVCILLFFYTFQSLIS
jgi:NADH:ubiquinone oxidoreductase subunit 4 (subunit M)